ncbi:MAG TPA: histidine triad nucleotide-binding protein [Pirellulales bacterium]|nr:histidine triad nucleotide-binding protein [Pirellulales bacterium]
MSKTIFQRIADHEIPADIVYEDEHCLAFRDLHPQAPTHVLLVPKRPIVSVDHLAAGDAALVGHMLCTIRQIAAQLGLTGGYRVVANCGPDAGQSVDHLHFHILGGRSLAWPPG